LVDGANIPYTDESEKGSEVMIAPKKAQKSSSAAVAHMNDLLEALTETFPASDPVAIHVELKSPGDRAIMRRASRSLRDTLRRGRGGSARRPG
jgi:hypothetical protein